MVKLKNVMNICGMIPLLEQRLKTMRTYEIPPNGRLITLESDYENQQQLSPCDKRNKPLYRPRKKQIICSDMCLRGPGTQKDLAVKWGIPLPADYMEFCSLYSEYIIAGRNPIRLLDAEEIRGDESFRDAWDVPETAAHRIFYFARVVEEPAHFAFRWNEDYSKMDIVYSWDYGDIGEPILLGKDGDRFVSDQTFTAWLQRMLETDAHPVFPGKKIPTSSGWIKQERTPLIRIE